MPSAKRGGGVKIVACTCRHDYQDRCYGPFHRVANIAADGGSTCTVCGKRHGMAKLAAVGKVASK